MDEYKYKRRVDNAKQQIFLSHEKLKTYKTKTTELKSNLEKAEASLQNVHDEKSKIEGGGGEKKMK